MPNNIISDILRRLRALEAILRIGDNGDASEARPPADAHSHRHDDVGEPRSRRIGESEATKLADAYVEVKARHPKWSSYRACKYVGRQHHRSVTGVAQIVKDLGLYDFTNRGKAMQAAARRRKP